MAQYFKCYLQTLAPLHLGCDEVYEPMSFVLDEASQQMTIYDPWSFFQQMSDMDKTKFIAICRQGTIESILQVYKFLKGRRAQGRLVSVCPGLVKHYQKTLALPTGDRRRLQQELNRFTIARTAFRPEDNRPYIPGSAVKGAFRTAYLNQVNREKRPPKWKGNPKELEKALLDGGAFETDPFRLLKVSDFMPVGEVKTKIIYAINEKKKISHYQARGPYQILEVILPGAVFVGSMILETPPKGAHITNPLNRETLLESARAFFSAEKKREEEHLFELGLKKITVPPPMPDFLLRLGRHSGAECLTIDGHRKIKIIQGRNEPPKYLDHATTFWLAAEEDKPANKSHLQPFGWVAGRKLTPDIEAEFARKEETWRQQQESQLCRSTLVAVAEPTPGQESTQQKQPSAASPAETWEKATLAWNPGRQELTATWAGKTATGKGKELVPQVLHKNLFDRKKAVPATVTVEPIGGKYYRILKIHEPS
jgi:CRISPR-associated protein Csm5